MFKRYRHFNVREFKLLWRYSHAGDLRGKKGGRLYWEKGSRMAEVEVLLADLNFGSIILIEGACSWYQNKALATICVIFLKIGQQFVIQSKNKKRGKDLNRTQYTISDSGSINFYFNFLTFYGVTRDIDISGCDKF